MHRGSGYTGTTKRYEEWNDNDASDYSQEDELPPPSARHDRLGHNESYNTHTRSLSSREKPSGIPRPGGHSSRPPSAMKAPRSRSYSSSSSMDSRTTNENVPPVPQIPQTRGRSENLETKNYTYNTGASHTHTRPHSGLSRRSSISRPRSSSCSRDSYVGAEDLPPLPSPSLHNDGDPVAEETPRRAPWAKDRGRFANATPTPIVETLANKDGGSRYEQPPTPVPTTRRSSLKPPSTFRNSTTPATTAPVPSRIPSVSTRPAREALKARQPLEGDIDSRNSSRPNSAAEINCADQTSSYTEGRKTPQAVSRRESSRIPAPHTSRIANNSRSEPAKQYPMGSTSVSSTATRSRNRQSSIYPRASSDEAKRQPEAIIISSMHDAQLPASPFAQPDLATGNRTPQRDGTEEAKEPETISSPVETMLIGSAPTSHVDKTPNSRRISTPARPNKGNSTYVPPTPAVSSVLSRRASEPSPKKGTPSTKAQSPTEQEPPPTIFQRLARRASFSTGKSPKTTATPKSPKPSNTPNNRLVVEHGTEESPFDLELETPRATISSVRNTGAKDMASNPHQDLSDRQKNRQSRIYQPAVYSGPTGNESKKLRSKAVEDISGDSEERLGSPFMGDGSPRFGIDERFRSPKKRTKSGLRHNTFESNDDRSQELLEYYGHGIIEPENAANYYIEGLPIGTVLSSPESTPAEQTPRGMMPASPITQSKKRSQYQYTSRLRSNNGVSNTEHKDPRDLEKSSDDNSDSRTPTAEFRSRSPSIVPPPIITRTSVTSLDSSTHSEFSDFSDQESDERGYLRADVHQGVGSDKGNSGKRTPTSVRFASQLTHHEPNQHAGRSGNSPSAPISYESSKLEASSTTAQRGSRISQLPVPRQRKTNSALFRALEQPYDSSSSATVASLGSSVTGNSNGSSEARTDSDYAENGTSTEGIHAVTSISSSLDGSGVGDIRWSGAQELSGAAEALFHNIERSHSGQDVKPIAMDSKDGYLSSIIDDSTFDTDEDTDSSNYDSSRNSSYRSNGQQGGYGKHSRMSTQDKRKAFHESWRASLEEEQFRQLEETYDAMEIHRQEVIWEFHESERTFVETLRVLVHLFVQPLRTQDQRRWIDGLSPDVMRLFDWLDDITNLHEQLLDALEVMRQDHEQVIILFSEAIQPFIPLMELYQPYVIHVEETAKRISSMARDPQSDFGEFIRMQSTLAEYEIDLEEAIRRPSSRLREYVSFFQTLLTLTPRTHPDHLSCFSLLHSMHAMVCVLEEVKTREEEYELIKNLLGRINGLPPHFSVATRENRLLAQGPLTRVCIRGDDRSAGKETSASCKSGLSAPGGSRTRSSSQSTANSFTTDSGSSCRSTSSSITRLKDSSTEYTMASDSSATSSNNPYDGSLSRKPASVQPTGLRPPKLRARTPGTDQSENMEMYALVFTEYLILTKGVAGSRRSKSPRRQSNERWSTLETLGVFQILGVVDYRGRFGYEYLISLDLAPLGDTSLSDTDTSWFIDIPCRTQKLQSDAHDLQKARQEWFRTLQQSYLHTLQSISFPHQPSEILPSTGQSESPSLTKNRFPKSPSQQLERGIRRKEARLPPISSVEEEREAREFWAERFKVVSKEVKRGYEGISRSIAPETPATRSSQPSRTGRFRSSGTFI